MIQAILWDVDGTLLDFLAAEAAAIRKLFRKYGWGVCSDEMLSRYSQINCSYWERLERGEITKPQVLLGRFQEFFQLENLDVSAAAAFNDDYQRNLGDTIVYCDDSYSIVKSLQGKVQQYAVSNGTVIAQNKKLRLSGFDKLMDGIFLSEELGFEKPNRSFFDELFRRTGPMNPDEVMIVGDSLTSDIRGGNNAGILTCWYNPSGKPPAADLRIDYTISDLHEIYRILADAR